jgi:hypothetical protein
MSDFDPDDICTFPNKGVVVNPLTCWQRMDQQAKRKTLQEAIEVLREYDEAEVRDAVELYVDALVYPKDAVSAIRRDDNHGAEDWYDGQIVNYLVGRLMAIRLVSRRANGYGWVREYADQRTCELVETKHREDCR